MAKLIIRKDPAGVLPVEIYEFKGSPHDAIVNYSRFLPCDFDVYLNDELIAKPDPENDFWGDSALFDAMGDDDVLRLVNLPKGFDPVTAILVGVALNIVSTILLPKPKTPGDQGSVKESPNNNLQGQTNIARSYQALPDVYGSPRIYPDLTGNPNQEYIQQSVGSAQKVVSQLMCLTVGTYFETEVLSANTDISNFPDSGYTMYRPVNGVTTVPFVRESFPVSEVNGQELLGTNLSPEEFQYEATAPANPVNRFINNIGRWELTLDRNDYPAIVPQDNYPRGGTMRITGLDSNLDPLTIDCEVTFGAVFGGEQGSSFIVWSSIVRQSGDAFQEITSITDVRVTINESVTVGPYRLPVESDKVWFDVIFDRGLKGDAVIQVEYSSNDSTYTILGEFTYTADSFDQQFFTEKIQLPTSQQWYLRFKRTNNASDDASEPDLAKLERVAAIIEQENKVFGDVTLIEVDITASRDVSNLRENEINLRGNRYVISYDRVNKAVDYTLRESRLGADHILHEWVEVFNQPPELLNLEELYFIYDNLSDPRLGFFDYTFDDLDVPLGERIQTIANCARVYAFQDGGIWQFKRDELQEVQTLLTRNDISTVNREYSYNFSPALNATTKDSVQVEWVDPETNKKAYIRRKLENGQFVEGAGINPSIIEMPYCQEEFNATNRAELEIRKLVYLRETFTDTFYQQALFLERGDKFRYEEVYNRGVIGGTIVRIVGNTAYTNEKIDFTFGTLKVEYTNQQGQIFGPYQIAPGPTEKSFTLVEGTLNNAYVADYINTQRGSQFYVTTTETLNQLQYVVDNKIPSADGRTVQLKFTLTDDRVYEYDQEE